ncbi:4Fe-4S dicluster domain-containing protein [Opitutus terrae]|uniref:Putative heterodisulfide reductase, C subunit n=1 Tax=Opitutus terrae (strain DSM 11246 / JCM 15787 / PB90-1) TaxID=452637 RepID=B1ZXF7_OPITP|nr:4Fe-4S dicluster domain-containing protein [Opitutus terrae]ACB76952.1 putative heterodisulfide reductase, C subunit [Opitutus terrae PB90-1]
MREVTRTIRFENDRVKGFSKEIMEVPGCERLQSCIQCGTCSGTCPLSVYMDHSPRQIMALVRSDFKNEVLTSNSIWLCASCYACTVECPREIRITDIMYALKQRAIQERVYPKHFPIPVLAREFAEMVRRTGRITETLLVMRLFLKANWRAVFSSWRLGIGLITTGRFVILPERIERRAELATILAAARNHREVV